MAHSENTHIQYQWAVEAATLISSTHWLAAPIPRWHEIPQYDWLNPSPQWDPATCHRPAVNTRGHHPLTRLDSFKIPILLLPHFLCSNFFSFHSTFILRDVAGIYAHIEKSCLSALFRGWGCWVPSPLCLSAQSSHFPPLMNAHINSKYRRRKPHFPSSTSILFFFLN